MFKSVHGDACKGILEVKEEDGVIYQNELVNCEYIWVAYNKDGENLGNLAKTVETFPEDIKWLKDEEDETLS